MTMEVASNSTGQTVSADYVFCKRQVICVKAITIFASFQKANIEALIQTK